MHICKEAPMYCPKNTRLCMSGSSSVENLIFKMCPLPPRPPPKYPRFVVGISENVPVYLKSILGTIRMQKQTVQKFIYFKIMTHPHQTKLSEIKTSCRSKIIVFTRNSKALSKAPARRPGWPRFGYDCV